MTTREEKERTKKIRKQILSTLAHTESMTRKEMSEAFECTLPQLDHAMRALRYDGIIDIRGMPGKQYYFLTDPSQRVEKDENPVVIIRPALPQDFNLPRYQTPMEWCAAYLGA